MEELTIQSARTQQNLLEWSQRVTDCRSSGMSVARWCAEHDIKVKTYYNWQKKVFAAMVVRQEKELERRRERGARFVELPSSGSETRRNDLVAAIRIGEASVEVYSGASAEVVAALCGGLSDVK